MSTSSGLTLRTHRFWHIQPLTALLRLIGWGRPAVRFSLTFLLDCKVPLCVSQPVGRFCFYRCIPVFYVFTCCTKLKTDPQDQGSDKPGCCRTPGQRPHLHRCPLLSSLSHFFSVKLGIKMLFQHIKLT